MVPLQRKGQDLLGVLWFETVLAFTAIGLRWFTRRYIGGKVGWDDWILMFTWVLMAAFAILCSVSVSHGMGIHAQELTLDQIVSGVKFLLIGQFTVAIAMGTSKVAVAVFLMRIVNNIWHRVILWFWIITMMSLSLLLAISVFAQCTPIESIWDPRVPRQHCVLNLTIIAKVMCSWSAAMDFFLAIFPWTVLWGLSMKRKEKIAICTSLSLGIIAGICGVARTAGLDVLKDTKDYLYATSDSVMWTMSELTLTIICVCIPALRPLFNRLTGCRSISLGYRYERSTNGTANATYGLQPQSTTGEIGRYGVESTGKSGRDISLSVVDVEKHAKGSTQRVQEVYVSRGDNPEGTKQLPTSSVPLPGTIA